MSLIFGYSLIQQQGSSAKTMDDFISEASIMGQFKHPNVIQLTGVVTVGKCKCASFSGIYHALWEDVGCWRPKTSHPRHLSDVANHFFSERTLNLRQACHKIGCTLFQTRKQKMPYFRVITRYRFSITDPANWWILIPASWRITARSLISWNCYLRSLACDSYTCSTGFPYR